MSKSDTQAATTGQRIAAHRRALGLSQEALGARLGVSRQAIYKWESDAAMPEIEKLVALSRLFGVSVGALLGVLVFHETLDAWTVLGIVCVLGGVILLAGGEKAVEQAAAAQ